VPQRGFQTVRSWPRTHPGPAGLPGPGRRRCRAPTTGGRGGRRHGRSATPGPADRIVEVHYTLLAPTPPVGCTPNRAVAVGSWSAMAWWRCCCAAPGVPGPPAGQVAPRQARPGRWRPGRPPVLRSRPTHCGSPTSPSTPPRTVQLSPNPQCGVQVCRIMPDAGPRLTVERLAPSSSLYVRPSQKVWEADGCGLTTAMPAV
jgi:hypothetical protein